ncbi:hypothetical protein C8K18_10772 [Paraburkholderia sp. GV068]|jgi:hypothetical protein|uniref:Uncharacterized protein n=1 Tax=Paraburkholderia graminis TaxID=60548 RepID=A0ABD5CPN7_9BURK|nr:hypothetical protein CUJ91_07530 [Paraburkholderia graminis]PTQ98490.1 hypothetical protein C8K19_10772 [Paraburkholderia sp. GV072]PUB03733.1 hypothetical protein C8K18_10772 [Paraburkholderia sp. GV068]MDQ0622786.1 hypothetical protein [Paraburkholderia graminis]MDR6207036.1 hypothetical protein [Paraburkholderia graminis]
MREFGSLYDAYDAVGHVPKLAPSALQTGMQKGSLVLGHSPLSVATDRRSTARRPARGLLHT